jgi:hypothetical protein
VNFHKFRKSGELSFDRQTNYRGSGSREVRVKS